MLKVVVFDSGYGGEIFADRLKEELPTIEVIRVIAWRDAEKVVASSRSARIVALESLRPYIGKVDLIIITNYLISLTSLRFLERKFQNQKFLGFELKAPDTFKDNRNLILSTTALSRTLKFHYFNTRLKQPYRVLNLDAWPGLIDDGELTAVKIKEDLSLFLIKNSDFVPNNLILANSQFTDIRRELQSAFSHHIRIYDSFDDTLRQTCKLLHIRGGIGKKS